MSLRRRADLAVLRVLQVSRRANPPPQKFEEPQRLNHLPSLPLSLANRQSLLETPKDASNVAAQLRAEFMRRSGYPHGRKGYVVDHIVPLECGGADVPANMQWQTVQEAKIKDRTERNCRR